MEAQEIPQYPAFGRYLEEFVRINLPPGTQKIRARAVDYLAAIVHLHKSMVNPWFHGRLVSGKGSKPLTVANFKIILRHYLTERPPEYRRGLGTRAHVELFLRLGRPEYLVLLLDEEVQGWMAALPLGEVPELERQGIERDYEAAVWSAWADQRRCVVLHGPPGVGKSTLITEIHRQAMLDFRFEIVVVLDGRAGRRDEAPEADFLEEIARQLNLPFDPQVPEKVFSRAREVTRHWQVLFLVDNGEAEWVPEILEKIAAPTTRYLIATRRTELTLGDHCQVLEMQPYTDAEVRAVLAEQFPEVRADAEEMEELLRLTLRNPYALAVAFSLARRDGMKAVLQMARQDPPAVPQGVEGHIFRFLYAGWEMLDGAGQQRWAEIGALATGYGRIGEYEARALAALWETSPERATGWMTAFCRDQGYCQAVGEGVRWRVHEQSWRFARNQLAQLPEGVQARAWAWVRRRAGEGDVQAWYRQAFEEAGRAGVREQLRAGQGYRLDDFSRWRWVGAAARALLTPWAYVSRGWAVMERYPEWVDTETYVRGYVLNRAIRRQMWIAAGVFWLLLVLLVQPFDVPRLLAQMANPQVAGGLQSLWNLLVVGTVFAGLVGLPLWWWRGPQRRFPRMWTRLWMGQMREESSPPEAQQTHPDDG